MTAHEAGKYLLCGDYTAYTPNGMELFDHEDRFNLIPRDGDIIYFYTAKLGRVSHVGIVEKAYYKDGCYTIRTIEGNTAAGTTFERDGGEVARKTYEVTPGQIGPYQRIRGFGTPRFGANTCSAEQLIDVARSQIGYVEKASAKDLDSPKGNPGAANYTKYGRWYAGITGKDYYTHSQWCQMLVSWCAYEACRAAAERPTGWVRVQNSNSWMYRKPGGEYARNEWIRDGGRWYVFDGNGIMIRGWFRQADGWYFLADDGAMCSGQWVTRDGESYYLTKSGLMATSCYIRSDKPFAPMQYIYYWVDASGRWIPAEDTERPDLKLYEVAE